MLTGLLVAGTIPPAAPPTVEQFNALDSLGVQIGIPAGALSAVLGLGIVVLKLWKDARQIDVAGANTRALEAEARATRIDEQRAREIESLRLSVEGLKAQVQRYEDEIQSVREEMREQRSKHDEQIEGIRATADARVLRAEERLLVATKTNFILSSRLAARGGDVLVSAEELAAAP